MSASRRRRIRQRVREGKSPLPKEEVAMNIAFIVVIGALLIIAFMFGGPTP